MKTTTREIIFRCIKCEKIIGDWTCGHNHGICPYCEHDANSTFIDTTQKYEDVPTVWGSFLIYLNRLYSK
jgi:hypothetical protein